MKTIFLILTLSFMNVIYAQKGVYRIKTHTLYTYTYNNTTNEFSELKNETSVNFLIVVKDDKLNIYNKLEEEFIVYQLVEQTTDDEYMTTTVSAIDKKGNNCSISVYFSVNDKSCIVNIFFDEENWGAVYYGVEL